MNDRERRRAPLRLIVFDFDGTLCDSADVKTDAFYDLYLENHGPAFAASVKQHHLANVGVSRYDKIRYVETEMLGNQPSDDDVECIVFSHGRKLTEGEVLDLLASSNAEAMIAGVEPLTRGICSTRIRNSA